MRCQTCGGADNKNRPTNRRTWEVCPDDFHKDAPLPELQATRKRVLELEQEVAFLRAKLEDERKAALEEAAKIVEDWSIAQVDAFDGYGNLFNLAHRRKLAAAIREKGK